MGKFALWLQSVAMLKYLFGDIMIPSRRLPIQARFPRIPVLAMYLSPYSCIEIGDSIPPTPLMNLGKHDYRKSGKRSM